MIQRRNQGGKFQYRFRVRYKNEDGEPKQKGSKWYRTKKEAQEAEIAFLVDIENRKKKKEETFVAGEYYFKDFHKKWVDFTAQGQAAKTIEDKQRILWVNFSGIMDMPIEEITTADILKIMSTPEFQKLSTSRKNKIYVYLNSVFEYSIQYYGKKNNPMKIIPRFRETAQEKLAEVEIYEPEDFNKLLDQIPERLSVIRDLFYFLYWTGMRLNEAKSITFSDVDFQNMTVRIHRQWEHKQQKWVPLKTKGSIRTIDIDEDLKKVILRQLELYKKEPDFSMEWFVFGGSSHLPNTTIQRTKNQAVKKADLKPVKIHSFRHSHASYLIHKGVSPYRISKRLGHSSISITMDVYGHLFKEKDYEILEAIREKSST